MLYSFLSHRDEWKWLSPIIYYILKKLLPVHFGVKVRKWYKCQSYFTKVLNSGNKYDKNLPQEYLKGLPGTIMLSAKVFAVSF